MIVDGGSFFFFTTDHVNFQGNNGSSRRNFPVKASRSIVDTIALEAETVTR